MVGLARGRVVAVTGTRRGAVELVVEMGTERGDALGYPDLCGPIEPGARVLVNTTAVDLGLGTGGFHIVVAVLDEDGGPIGSYDGRVIKARYTPSQTAVRSLEEAHRDTIEGASGLGGMPVVVAPLHSMVGPAAAGAKAAGADRVVYVMTDGAALPGALSRLVPSLRSCGLLDAFVTSGQAFGGEEECVTLFTGLLGAREVLGADVAIVADGPGNLGTDTRWGVSALGSGSSLNAVSVVGGRPVAALRISFADRRDRHRGVSHHSLTALGEVCLVPATVAVPQLEGVEREIVWEALRTARLEERHQLVEANGAPALDELRERGVPATSMGRTPEQDPAFFLAAGAAGVIAGRMASDSRRWRKGTQG
jgi:hypothetical protein